MRGLAPQPPIWALPFQTELPTLGWGYLPEPRAAWPLSGGTPDACSDIKGPGGPARPFASCDAAGFGPGGGRSGLEGREDDPSPAGERLG